MYIYIYVYLLVDNFSLSGKSTTCHETLTTASHTLSLFVNIQFQRILI